MNTKESTISEVGDDASGEPALANGNVTGSDAASETNRLTETPGDADTVLMTRERKSRPTPHDLGKAVCDAYSAAVGGRAFNGDPLPTWEEMCNDEKKAHLVKAWVAAAGGVHNALILDAVFAPLEDEPTYRESEIPFAVAERIVKARMVAEVEKMDWNLPDLRLQAEKRMGNVELEWSACGPTYSRTPSAPTIKAAIALIESKEQFLAKQIAAAKKKRDEADAEIARLEGGSNV